MDSNSPEIETDSLQAVKSLRSKFEKLALAQPNSNSLPLPTPQRAELLTVTAPSSPRPRANSNAALDAPFTDGVHLRSSSSSSDLRVPARRAPPPPPPRVSKLLSPSPTPSPAPSPLLRPVPIPQGSIFAALQSPKVEIQELNLPPTVSSLRSKFVTLTPPASPIRTQSQSSRQSISAIFTDPRPAIPPRPASVLGMPHNTITTNDITLTTPTKSPSPLSTDDDGNALASSSKYPPPPVPVRRQNGNGHGGQTPGAISIRSLGVHLDDPTLVTLESDSSPTPASRSSRSATVPPPRPPRRGQGSSISPGKADSTRMTSSVPEPKSFMSPPPTRPPLPVRRGALQAQEEPLPSTPPPLPSRSQFMTPSNGEARDPAAASERKPLGASKLPPPPTRTIALGDKLPPPRRPPTPSSSEDSGDEDEPRAQHAIDLMPDSSSSSRRAPTLTFREGHHPEPRVHVHPHSCVALAGSWVVVGHGHHVKIYDLKVGEGPVHSLDTKEMGAKDFKVTCMEFRPTVSLPDRGFLLWIGTREGHIFEMDIRTGTVRGIKHAAHLHPITHIFRHARSMVTLDDSGKTLLFSPDSAEDISLLLTTPRVIRTTEKQDFVKLLDGKLWTAARAEHQHHGATPGRVPVVRVYDIFNPASTGRSLLPSEHVGPVTSATILPSQPSTVYVGHEGGYVSLWALDTPDGYPRCDEVLKVSTSDVLSLEGVNERLWAGSRNGMISAYDVGVRPWVVTNCWGAHGGLPVVRLVVNCWAIGGMGRLCVGSVGRDEVLRLWDGLLGWDWVDKELVKLETSFSTFRDLSLLVISWNCDSARPDALTSSPQNTTFLHSALHAVPAPPSIIIFGFQEVIDLESRKMVAKNVLLGGKKKPDDGLSEKVTGAYKRWYDCLVGAVRAAWPGEGYGVVCTESLVGLFTCVFVKSAERGAFGDVAITTIKRGMGGRYGNKGGIVGRFVIGDSSICFINCHLAAGQGAVRRRNADVAGMLEEKAVFAPTEHPNAYVGGGDGTMVLDHEFVILNGDMNYRIDHRRDAILTAIKSGDLTSLLPHDQLLREIKHNRACRLRNFSEGPLTFAPTYKYDPRSPAYDTSEKRRSPAWCDRILWRARVPGRVRQMHYGRYEADVSDHRPISAGFEVTVKSFDYGERERAAGVVRARWVGEEERLLLKMTQFYVGQALI
ncbi:Endonuclease/exonuclease/phosphatase [Crassisporium funariophilum]|nr:Endonuclease/exonuclease/phosphatase [Crassisporium funariophilum]